VEKYLGGIDKKLSNASFLDNAPGDVVAKEKEKKARFEREVATLKDNLAALS
jgi:valyl-tRNA synthetase